MSTLRTAVHAVAAGLLFGLAGCAASAGQWRETPAAVQTIYRAGVPHTTASGAPRLGYDPAQSFFPIGLYNALTGDEYGRIYDYASYAAQGFNTVVPWVDEPLAEVVEAAHRSGLQVIPYQPSDADLATFAGDPAILAWSVDHEPSMAPPDEAGRARLAAFRARREAIRALDPGRPVLTINSPSISPPRTELWVEWSRAGDVVSFWKYPFRTPPVASLSGPRGVPEVTLLAASAVEERKPVWYVAQAMESPLLDWYMPSEGEARAAVYAALVHGATGIIWFGLDSYVARNGKVLGIAPDPAADYGVDLPRKPQFKPVLVASAEELAGSRRLWAAVGRLNRELATLTPVILAPTAGRDYAVAVRGETVTDAPVRTLLKRQGEDFVLLAVNLDNRPVEARFDFGAAVRGLEPMFADGPPATVAERGWQARFAPFGVRVWRFRLGPAG